SVEIAYKWADSKLFDKSSQPELRIKLINHNSEAALVSFNADYYIDGVLQETNEIKFFCVKAKRSSYGKVNGIILQNEKLSRVELESENFKLEFSKISIRKTKSCDIEE